MVGDPVDHSLSPTIHTAALDLLGIAGTYTARNVDRAGLAAVIDELVAGDLDGVNVTMPHKKLAAQLVARVAATAARTGAVNTITRVGGEAVGHNTDVAGVRLAWEWAGLPVDRPVVVMGSGGAAAAALVAVAEMEVVGPVTVLARSAAAAAAMVDEVAVTAAVAPIGTEPAYGAVVVNATPLGMAGETLPVSVERAGGLLDMAYADRPTPAVAAAVAAGLPVADGIGVLLGQATASFRLWTGRQPPLPVMRAAVEVELARRRGDG